MAEGIRLNPEIPAHLPPSGAWKVNPSKLAKFYAPVDDRGFVLPDATVETILGLFREDYEWPVDWSEDAPETLRPNDHHFHWAAAMYADGIYNGVCTDIPKKFRDLPTMRGVLPRQFHNTLHNVTFPPERPLLKDMRYYLESFRVAKRLFEAAEKALEKEKLFETADDERKLKKYLNSYEQVFANYSDKRKKMIGIGALKVLGIKESLNFESFPDVVRVLGSCAFVIPTDYVTRYFAGGVARAA